MENPQNIRTRGRKKIIWNAKIFFIFLQLDAIFYALFDLTFPSLRNAVT
jgi:hypothetical protein